jgi:hypothetical protein
MNTQQLTAKALNVVNYTNKRLDAWYKNAKEDYDVNGFGVATFDKENNSIVVNFTENNVCSKFTIEDWADEAIEYAFNVWMEA